MGSVAPSEQKAKRTEMDPEDAYNAACSHWLRCEKCKRAGGEWAASYLLCETGRILGQRWADAEERYARADGR